MNKVLLIGRVSRLSDLKTIENTDKKVLTFDLAVNRKFKNKDGEYESDFIPIVMWGALAEFAARYICIGKLLSVNGRIQIRSYENKEGIKRYTTEVIAEEIQFLDSKKSDQTDQTNQTEQANLKKVN